MYPPKVSKSLNVGTQPVKPPLIGGKVVACISHDHCSLLASQNAPIHAETLINSDSGETWLNSNETLPENVEIFVFI